MAYTDRISNALVGGTMAFKTLGWLGDSITIVDYLGPTGQGVTNQRLSFAALVSHYYGATMNNQAASGRILSSFLPFQSGAVGSATANFDGEWLFDDPNWYWWDPDAASWIAVADNGISVSRNGTNTVLLNNLINDTTCYHVIISQTGVNDNTANIDAGAGDDGAHGSRHYRLLMEEIIKRLKAADKTVMIVTGLTASEATFHGLSGNYVQNLIGRFSESARHAAYNEGLRCCDTGLRLNLEIANGRVDILTRSSNYKPDVLTQQEWDDYLAATGDPNADTNLYRVFDESEDYLHIEDADRTDFWFNIHPNAFGHYLNANEIIKFINEGGFV